MLSRIVLFLGLLLVPNLAFAQSGGTTTRPTWFNGTTQNYISTTNPLPVATTGSGTITTAPGPVTTTTTNSTVSVTNTFQAALAASGTRKACLLQNTGTHVEYVYYGTIGSATTSNAFQINPGQTISCATTNGLVLTDAVNITGTAGDGYIVTNQ